MVGRPFPVVREWSGGPRIGTGVVGRPFRRFESVREALLVVWEWSGHPLGGPSVFGRPSQKSGNGR